MVEWRVSPHLIPYEEAVAVMEERVRGIFQGIASEMVWLLEHPPLYTAGASAKASDLLCPTDLPVYQTGRGGQYTYHGPGQRVAYVMVDLAKRGKDIRSFVAALEQWVINTLSHYGITGERRHERVGIWVNHNGFDQKIAALGIRLRHWISFHGIAINVSPDLTHFNGIIPCGLNQYGVTSCAALGVPIDMSDFDEALRKEWERSGVSIEGT